MRAPPVYQDAYQIVFTPWRLSPKRAAIVVVAIMLWFLLGALLGLIRPDPEPRPEPVKSGPSQLAEG